jgi:hypothetical protein
VRWHVGESAQLLSRSKTKTSMPVHAESCTTHALLRHWDSKQVGFCSECRSWWALCCDSCWCAVPGARARPSRTATAFPHQIQSDLYRCPHAAAVAQGPAQLRQCPAHANPACSKICVRRVLLRSAQRSCCSVQHKPSPPQLAVFSTSPAAVTSTSPALPSCSVQHKPSPPHAQDAVAQSPAQPRWCPAQAIHHRLPHA